jgi:hypothetical protein
MIWFVVRSCREAARWDSNNDFPDDGGEVRSMGKRSERWDTSERRDCTTVGVCTIPDGISDSPGERSRKIP